MSYLKGIPVDIITAPTDAATVQAILQIAEAFGLETVAEDVETEAGLSIPKEHGRKYAQSDLFSLAVPYVDLITYARQDTTG